MKSLFLSCLVLSIAACEPGVTGAGSLVTTQPESAGENCASGGFKVTMGLDDGFPGGTANNLILEPEEVDSVRYLCNGVPGVAGADGIAGLDGSNGQDGAQGPQGGTGPGLESFQCLSTEGNPHYSIYWQACYDTEWVFWSYKTNYLPQDSNARYALDGTDVVFDSVTRLSWERDQSATTMDYAAALAYCAGRTTGGLSAGSWRLPTRSELQSLVDYSAYNPAINAAAFPGATADYFWTSTPFAGNSGRAWRIYFTGGYVRDFDISTLSHVRCVR